MRIRRRSVFSRGRDRGEGDRRRAIRLMGIVRAHTQSVRRISGAERWSMEK